MNKLPTLSVSSSLIKQRVKKESERIGKDEEYGKTAGAGKGLFIDCDFQHLQPMVW